MKRVLSKMPFASDIIAPHIRLVGQQPLPEINARGGRDIEGWKAVYEAVVQPGGGGEASANRRLGERDGWTPWRRCSLDCGHVRVVLPVLIAG